MATNNLQSEQMSFCDFKSRHLNKTRRTSNLYVYTLKEMDSAN